MSRRAELDEHQSLSSYEAEQVGRIAAWKSQPPNPLSELWKTVAGAGANLVEKVIPDRLAELAIIQADDVAETLASRREVERRAGVKDLGELHHRPLEECDRMAEQVGMTALAISTVEGAATGAGGAFTTLIDVPILFTLALRTIRKIGYCYGYPLEGRRGSATVNGVLVVALSGSLELRRTRLHRLRELEDLIIEETEEDVLTDEALSLLFQLEVFEEIPGLGAISGALLNAAFLRRVDVTARRIFQERWLRDTGKVAEIEPAEAHPRLLAPGISGALGRLAYSGMYALGFSAALPVYAVSALARPMGDALGNGLRDVGRSAESRWDDLIARRSRRRATAST